VTNDSHSEPIASIVPSRLQPKAVATELNERLKHGAELILPNGHQPAAVLRQYSPRYQLRLFDTTIYLSRVVQNESIRFFVAYVTQDNALGKIFARLFYKDISLIWRCASHYAQFDNGVWIGKGAVTTVVERGMEYLESLEATTDLPLEIQTALEEFSHRLKVIPYDDVAIPIALRHAPRQRIQPYRDFLAPRAKAAKNRAQLPNRGRSVARFRRAADPTSLYFVAGFEPDLLTGVLERASLASSLYGGAVTRYRILSVNRQIQYSLVASRKHFFIASVQSISAKLSSFAVRVIDAVVDETVLLPGYDYHFLDEEADPPELHSQIPKGFAGSQSRTDPSRADTSRWLNQVPMLRAFARAHRAGKLTPKL
jgi:hypothetical protein